jgi:hypothetical protein
MSGAIQAPFSVKFVRSLMEVIGLDPAKDRVRSITIRAHCSKGVEVTVEHAVDRGVLGRLGMMPKRYRLIARDDCNIFRDEPRPEMSPYAPPKGSVEVGNSHHHEISSEDMESAARVLGRISRPSGAVQPEPEPEPVRFREFT